MILTDQFPFFFVLFITHLVLVYFVVHAVSDTVKAHVKKTDDQYRIIGRTSIIFILWLIVVLNLTLTGDIKGSGGNLSLPLAMTLPILAGLILYRWEPFKKIVNAIPQYWLLGIQALRIPYGIIVLREFELGILPDQWRLVAGYGDIIVGIVAVIAAFIVFESIKRKDKYIKSTVVIGNAFGLLDFLIVLPTAALMVTPFTPEVFAINTIPAFAVPIFVLLHVYSLLALGNDKPVKKKTSHKKRKK